MLRDSGGAKAPVADGSVPSNPGTKENPKLVSSMDIIKTSVRESSLTGFGDARQGGQRQQRSRGPDLVALVSFKRAV